MRYGEEERNGIPQWHAQDEINEEGLEEGDWLCRLNEGIDRYPK